jgi:hypothetical protein
MDVEMMIISEKQFQSFLDICESHTPLFVRTFRMFAVLTTEVQPLVGAIKPDGDERVVFIAYPMLESILHKRDEQHGRDGLIGDVLWYVNINLYFICIS